VFPAAPEGVSVIPLPDTLGFAEPPPREPQPNHKWSGRLLRQALRPLSSEPAKAPQAPLSPITQLPIPPIQPIGSRLGAANFTWQFLIVRVVRDN